MINIYQNSTALINASVGEGFGLPLVEASFFGLPLILRDTQIFREIAGDKSWFFSTKEYRELAISLISWIEEYSRGNISSNTDIKVISWRESCNQILEIFNTYEFEKGKIY